MEKQIEEMARKMCRNYMPNGDCFCNEEPCALECVYGYCAERAYCAGYRKQSEGEWKQVSDKAPRYVCTACNHLFNNKGYKFCPNCGAKKKGGEG